VNIDIFVNTRDELESYDIDDCLVIVIEISKQNLRQDISSILNTEDLENIQKHLNRINHSPSSINNSENSKDRKYWFYVIAFFKLILFV
jgi:hypothetical protein